MVRFESDKDSTQDSSNDEYGYYGSSLFPAKILCFLGAPDESIHAMIHCCKTNDHSQDSILAECWEQEYKVDDNMLVPLLRCVSVDSFETPCFVVEDKHEIMKKWE